MGKQLVVSGSRLIVFVCIPKDKVNLLQGIPTLHRGNIRIGILFNPFVMREFPYRYLKAQLNSQTAIGENELLAFSERLTFFGHVGIRDKTEGTAKPAEGLKLFFRPSAA